MIHPKITSPCRTPQRKKRVTTSAQRSLVDNRQDVETIPTESVPVRYSDIYQQEKVQVGMGNFFKKKKTYPIAPDAFIPNSTCRKMFRRKESPSVVTKDFELRLDILNNLQNKHDTRDDEEWPELDDQEKKVTTSSAKKSKGTVVSQPKVKIPDLFKRMQNESWWKQEKQEKANLHSFLLYLIEILKFKQIDSYESACYYTAEIFRTYGIEPLVVNQILDIFLGHLTNKSSMDRLDICTIRTIAQFMTERKDIIVRLLEYALACQANDDLRLETINAVKFITDVDSSDGIDWILDHMSVVYEASDNSFSLKILIGTFQNTSKTVGSEELEEGIHPLLQKISEERWFPRGHSRMTLDCVLQAIIAKLPNATKSLVKTLTTHLIQLHRGIGYSEEELHRVIEALISLLSHSDADYRLIGATNLANLGEETKAIDFALLNSFLNDPRVLVRTECCDVLKKLTGINSEMVLKDCADEISYLETLPEENFSLQNYLRKKNRLPTPPLVSVEEPSIEVVEESSAVPVEADEVIVPRLPSPQIVEEPAIMENPPLPIQVESTEFSPAKSVSPIVTPTQPAIRMESNEKINSVPKVPIRRSVTQLTRSNQPSPSPTKSSRSEKISRRHSSLLPNNTDMWDLYVKQNEKETDELPMIHFPVPQGSVISQEQTADPIQIIIGEHQQTVDFYRMLPSRRILVPHKICMENVLTDQSHLIVDHYSPPPPLRHSMNVFDFNYNQHQLIEVETVQLLSSLVIRGIQVHRQYEKFIPGPNSLSFSTALNVSQAHLHPSSSVQQANSYSTPWKIPNLAFQRPTTREIARMQSNIQAKATRKGINVHKAQNIEGVLSTLLKNNHKPRQSTSDYSPPRQVDKTHAWLLVQLLKAQGVFDAENYLRKIIQVYPKFTPILHTKIPQNLVSIIWNDPVTKQIASIFGHQQDRSSMTNSTMKRSDTKTSVPTSDEEYAVDGQNYSALINREESNKKFLPIIRGSKMNLPHHVLKFGLQELEMGYSDSSVNETPRKHRKRRVYTHRMTPTNENMFNRHDRVNNQLHQMMTTDYHPTSYVPIITRPPMWPKRSH